MNWCIILVYNKQISIWCYNGKLYILQHLYIEFSLFKILEDAELGEELRFVCVEGAVSSSKTTR